MLAQVIAMGVLCDRDAAKRVIAMRRFVRSRWAVTRNSESIDARVDRLCEWLWARRSEGGKSVRDLLEFVLWGSQPSDMEHRLWLGVRGKEYSLPHLGQSALGEAVGWARPDDYPPRNNRTNKALRALGHDVRLFSKA